MLPGSVLVVEDEPGVRRFIRRALERNGYEVIEAADGSKALRATESCRGELDAVLTDVDMPEMSGIALARALAGRFPRVPLLFFPGSTRELLDSPERSDSPEIILQKPFSEEDLLGTLRRTIGTARQGSAEGR